MTETTAEDMLPTAKDALAAAEKPFDRGPLRTYEVTWTSGRVETVKGHQVAMPFGLTFSGGYGDRHLTIHGEFDGHWRLVLAAHPDVIRSVRDVTDEYDAAEEDVQDAVPQEA